MGWLRWWQGTVTDPKWRVVAARASVTHCNAGNRPVTVASVIAVWAVLLEDGQKHQGVIPRIDCEEIAILLGLEVSEVEAIVQALRDKGSIDDKGLKNWDKWQPKREDDSRERVAKFRERQRAVTHGNAPVTPRNAPEPEPEPEPDSVSGSVSSPVPTVPLFPTLPPTAAAAGASAGEKKSKSKANSAPAYSEAFERFWLAYPRSPNMSKADAYTAWRRLSPADQDRCEAGGRRYAEWLAEKQRQRPDHPAAHASTFINGRRFDGFTEGWGVEAPPEPAAAPLMSSEDFARLLEETFRPDPMRTTQ